jgi:hypothetical protein
MVDFIISMVIDELRYSVAIDSPYLRIDESCVGTCTDVAAARTSTSILISLFRQLRVWSTVFICAEGSIVISIYQDCCKGGSGVGTDADERRLRAYC